MPHGQAPAQKPQPMQRFSFTAISKPCSPPSLLDMAPWGQMVMQMSHSRQEPQEEQADAH
jgi:hypothetical protein